MQSKTRRGMISRRGYETVAETERVLSARDKGERSREMEQQRDGQS